MRQGFNSGANFGMNSWINQKQKILRQGTEGVNLLCEDEVYGKIISEAKRCLDLSKGRMLCIIPEDSFNPAKDYHPIENALCEAGIGSYYFKGAGIEGASDYEIDLRVIGKRF